MSSEVASIVLIIGMLVNFLTIVHFFTKLEHRLTRTEIHILHIMRNAGMKVREADLGMENINE